MEISIQVIEDNAIVIKGLRSATESRKISDNRKAALKNHLNEEHFTEKVLNTIAFLIDYEANAGRRSVCVTGYGNPSSPLRNSDYRMLDVMEEVLETEILPILEKQGYTCSVSRHPFRKGEYFDIHIKW